MKTTVNTVTGIGLPDSLFTVFAVSHGDRNEFSDVQSENRLFP